MLTLRCSEKISKILKEHKFPQNSIEFESDYYKGDGTETLQYYPTKITEDLIFAPYISEVLDRFEIDLDLYISIEYKGNNNWTYRIFDPTKNIEITSELIGVELSSNAYEEAILKAIEYCDSKEEKIKIY